MPARKDIKKIMIIGSGAIVIGQACEFDYSGVQAVKALKEEGYEVILVNPNPATVMTTPGIADRIYMEPLQSSYLEEIIKKEKPDALLPTMGGQTALNCTLKLEDEGILSRYSVEVIGASVDAIRVAENRGLFKATAQTIGLESPRSLLVNNVRDAKLFVREVGLPLIIRPSFTLGGLGGSIAYTAQELDWLMDKALMQSPVHEALVEESLIGWKEFELEVMRDKADNAVVICSIENLDSMGVHTGDSITVAPIQTLSDVEYQRMRTASLAVLRVVGIDCGGSNVQFAVDPKTGRMLLIEMNPRVSRSSALASKATGFPIARCSAKLAVGFTLDEIINDITGKTVSCFEPALDYCAVKTPRFEVEKFPKGYHELGTQMKSVGESLAIGRTFIEALNKSIRAAENGYDGLEELPLEEDTLLHMASTQHVRRLFAVYTLLKKNPAFPAAQISTYDPWFIRQLLEQIELEKKIESEGAGSGDNLYQAKRFGLSDKRIAKLTGKDEQSIRALRESENLYSSYHFIDTCAGEFTANTPYFYSTYGEIDEGGALEEDAVIIIGSGPNRIGQGLEFDTCCTIASLAFRKQGIKTIMVNSNPETVSTDFNVSDRLYMEPLTVEHVLEILRKEKTKKVVLQLGGQTPLNMARALESSGADVVGTSVQGIHDTEDRALFSQLLKTINLKQPENITVFSKEDAYDSASDIGFPVLLRPSFVLGGRSMFIAYSPEEMADYFTRGIRVDKDNPVLVDQFLEDAFEYDVDAVSDGVNVYIGGIMQHIEAAGIHSGDSACVFPAYKSEPHLLLEMKNATVRIAREAKIKGFLNIQFAVKDHILYVLEVNPRASRTIPFISKATGVNMVEAAVRTWLGESLEDQGLTNGGMGEGTCITGWAVKEAVFSFDRFHETDPILGPEMKSTGEVIGTGESFGEAFAKAQAAAGCPLPLTGKVAVSVHKEDLKTILPIVQDLNALGFSIAATRGNAAFLFENGIFAEVILKIQEGRPNLIDHMKTGRLALIINTPLGRYSQKGDEYIRIEAVKRKVPYTTTSSAARAAVEGIKYLVKKEISVRPLPGSWNIYGA